MRIKRTICFLITLCLLVSGVPALAAETALSSTTPPEISTTGDVWDGTATEPKNLISKDGVYYYEITKCSELAYVAQTGGEWLSYNYILGNDLNINNVSLDTDENGTLENSEQLLTWTSIGAVNGYSFMGLFDGGGYTISGSNRSIFRGLADDAVVSNLNVANAYISSAVFANIVGGIVGYSSGTITNCSFSGTIKYNKNSQYIDSDDGIGGIVGHSDFGIVSNCKNYGTIISNYRSGGIVGANYGTIDSCINYGSIKVEGGSAGGISAAIGDSLSARIVNCSNYGNISTTDGNAGGIIGCDQSNSWIDTTVNGCRNYGNISAIATTEDNKYARAGGIMGYACAAISKCFNYGTVVGGTIAGGICGYANVGRINSCANFANVSSSHSAAGISGGANTNQYNVLSISACYNRGDISGTDKCGGLLGNPGEGENIGNINNSYNLGKVSGVNYLGGIIGVDKHYSIINCYNISVVSGESNCGQIAGTSDYIWGKSAVTNNYYFADVFTAFSDVADAKDVAESKSLDELKQQATFVNWNFNTVWTIDPDLNGGYPYLQWQSFDNSPTGVNSVTLDKSELSLAEGDSTYLTASISPTTATDKSVTWTSDAPAVATVSIAGKVTAISTGTAKITVTASNGIYASCVVTVTARATDEYQLTALSITDTTDNKLTAIPTTDFWATVSLKKINDGGNSVVLLAAYDKDGRFLSVNFARAADIPVGSTVQLGFMLSNSKGEIAYIKAFCIASLSNFVPLSPGVQFPNT